MQVDFDVAVIYVALLDNVPSNQRADRDRDKDCTVVANDNGMRWPLIAFPEDWYASL